MLKEICRYTSKKIIHIHLASLSLESCMSQAVVNGPVPDDFGHSAVRPEVVLRFILRPFLGQSWQISAGFFVGPTGESVR